MREVKSTPAFEKAYRKFVRRHPLLQKKNDEALKQMHLDVFTPSLQTHKLSGKLFGLLACACGYDCRIVFSIEKEQESDEEVIVLIDIGTHESLLNSCKGKFYVNAHSLLDSGGVSCLPPHQSAGVRPSQRDAQKQVQGKPRNAPLDLSSTMWKMRNLRKSEPTNGEKH
jgi:mRNA-degrading endonuclease YafQ of YafQ-DinJ toxin-antitoxin module